MEFYMKKFLASALAITLIGSSVASFAQGHSSHGSNSQRGGMSSSEMHVMKQEMQKKMSAAKTDEERHAVMAEQQKLMQGKRGSMMAMHSKEHSMGGMNGNNAGRQQMMQKHMGSMNAQMPTGEMSH
jgi:coenzyme F420-reducing hydrogenase alpha subunit